MSEDHLNARAVSKLVSRRVLETCQLSDLEDCEYEITSPIAALFLQVTSSQTAGSTVLSFFLELHNAKIALRRKI